MCYDQGVERIENFYLKFLRVFLIILATIAIIYGIFNLFYSFYEITKTADIEQVETPRWSELRYEVLPITRPIKELEDQTEEERIEQQEPETPFYNPKYDLILKNLQELFTDEQRSLFSLSFNRDYLLDFNQNIPEYLLEGFIDGLVDLSEDLLQENLIKRIESPEKKITLIMDSFEAYEFAFKMGIYSVNSSNVEAQEEMEDRNANGYSQIIFTLYALGGFILLLICSLVLKVEYNLRKIAPAISTKNEN